MSHYFIAIHMNEKLREIFSSWQEELNDVFPFKQWPHKEDLHITLKFLGEVDDRKIERLVKELLAVETIAAFDLAVGGLGTFGKRVLWVGVEKNDPLKELQEVVEQAALNIGYEKEKREYRPHITLAKRWQGEDSALPYIEDKWNRSYSLHVKEIVLFRIHPSESPKYEVVERFPLADD